MQVLRCDPSSAGLERNAVKNAEDVLPGNHPTNLKAELMKAVGGGEVCW